MKIRCGERCAPALQSAGYRVLEAPDGRAALLVFDEHRAHVDLVVTDVVMPHLSGRELVLALHAREPGLPVIYTSGYADDAVLRRGISRADVQFLPKPYTPISLMQKVRDVIDLTKGRPSSQSPADPHLRARRQSQVTVGDHAPAGPVSPLSITVVPASVHATRTGRASTVLSDVTT